VNRWHPTQGDVDARHTTLGADRWGNAQVVYATTASGVFKTSNGGTAWALSYTDGTTQFTGIAIDPANSMIVYAGVVRKDPQDRQRRHQLGRQLHRLRRRPQQPRPHQVDRGVGHVGVRRRIQQR